MSNIFQYITKPCCMCGKRSALSLDRNKYLKRQQGTLVQDAFPEMSADDRELLITGTHPGCWDKMFSVKLFPFLQLFERLNQCQH